MTHPQTSVMLNQIEAFPPLPVTVTKVLDVTSNPESSSQDLMQAVIPDQTMCSAILKAANSAFFGVPREISTIERAVVLLGYEEIKNIVIGKAIFSSLPKLSKEARQTVGLFWEHAFTCGLAAKIIAEHLRLSPCELFIDGLIHDIGKIAMLLAFPNEYSVLQNISTPDHVHCTTEEKNRFGISHDEAGLQLAKRWLLPEQLMMAIGYHHIPQDAPSNIERPLIIQVADVLSLIHSYSDSMDGEEVEKIFNDFFPEIAALWQSNQLNWEPENLGAWFKKLVQSRENEQSVLSIFTSS